jgi:hypothetical protein
MQEKFNPKKKSEYSIKDESELLLKVNFISPA